MIEDYLAKMQWACLRRLDGENVSLLGVSRIAEFEASMLDIGAAESHPMISPLRHDFSSADAFGVQIWVGDKLAGGVAAKVVDLGDMSLAQHWIESYRRLYGGNVSAPVSEFCHAAQSEVRGRVVYLGQLYLQDQYRGTGINLGLVLHYMHALSAQKWSPDWIYGFVRQGDVLSGRSAWYGFTRQYLGAQTWDDKVLTRSTGEYLALLSRADLLDIASFSVRHPDKFCPDRGGVV